MRCSYILLGLVSFLSTASAVAVADIYYFQDGNCQQSWTFGCTSIPDLICCDIALIRTPSVKFSRMPDGASGATYAAVQGYNCPANGVSAKLEDQGKASGGTLCLNAGGLSVNGAQWVSASDQSKIKRDGGWSVPVKGSMKPNVAVIDGHHFNINGDVPEAVTQTLLDAVINGTHAKDIPSHCHKHRFQ